MLVREFLFPEQGQGKNNKLNFLWPKMARLGPGPFCAFFPQEMRHIHFFWGPEMGGFGGGGQKVYVEKVYVFFLSLAEWVLSNWGSGYLFSIVHIGLQLSSFCNETSFYSVTLLAGHGEICHPHGDPQRRSTWISCMVFFKKSPRSMWIGVLWAGLRVAMWISHVGGKFRHGLLEKSLISKGHRCAHIQLQTCVQEFHRVALKLSFARAPMWIFPRNAAIRAALPKRKNPFQGFPKKGFLGRGEISIIGVARAPVAIIHFASNPCENL